MHNLTQEFINAFGTNTLPDTLIALIAFEEQYGGSSYSQHFYLRTDTERTPGFGQYSLAEEYFNRVLVFANADGTGSQYAFWINQPGCALEEAPIILLGSEGHIQVMAENILALLQLLSFGSETMDGTFRKDLHKFKEPENAVIFRNWMKNKLNIDPIKISTVNTSKEVNDIIKRAIDKYDKSFKNWMQTLPPQYPGAIDFS